MKKIIGLKICHDGNKGWILFRNSRPIAHRDFFPSGFWINGDLEWFYNGALRLRAGSTYEQAKALEDSQKDNV